MEKKPEQPECPPATQSQPAPEYHEYRPYRGRGGAYYRGGRGQYHGGMQYVPKGTALAGTSASAEKGGYEPRQEFTHFISIPLNQPDLVKKMAQLQTDILAQKFPGVEPRLFVTGRTLHLTILMLVLPDAPKQELAKKAFASCKEKIDEIMAKQPFHLTLKSLSCIAKGDVAQQTKVVYVKMGDEKQLELLKKVSNVIISAMLEHGVIKESELSHISKVDGLYFPDTFHITIMNSTFAHKGRFYTFNSAPLLKVFEGTELGTCIVDEIHVSTRFSYTGDGFYTPLAILPLGKSMPVVPAAKPAVST